MYKADEIVVLKGHARYKTGKSHVLLLMQISYPFIVWNNVPKFHENRVGSFRAMRQSLCVYCGVTKVGDTTLGAGAHKLDRYPFRKMRKSQEHFPL